MLLKNRAYTFFLTCPADVRADYQQLSQALVREYNSPELLYCKRQLLYSIRQNAEPSSTYLTKLEKLSQNLEVDNQTKIYIMIAGLDKPYQTFIQLKQPENYSTATKALLLKKAIAYPTAIDPILETLVETF